MFSSLAKQQDSGKVTYFDLLDRVGKILPSSQQWCPGEKRSLPPWSQYWLARNNIHEQSGVQTPGRSGHATGRRFFAIFRTQSLLIGFGGERRLRWFTLVSDIPSPSKPINSDWVRVCCWAAVSVFSLKSACLFALLAVFFTFSFPPSSFQFPTLSRFSTDLRSV